jgi:hypothetical protein
MDSTTSAIRRLAWRIAQNGGFDEVRYEEQVFCFEDRKDAPSSEGREDLN